MQKKNKDFIIRIVLYAITFILIALVYLGFIDLEKLKDTTGAVLLFVTYVALEIFKIRNSFKQTDMENIKKIEQASEEIKGGNNEN